MIQQVLAIWSLAPLPFLKPVCTSGISQFTYCWSLACRILSITLLACEMSAIVLLFILMKNGKSIYQILVDYLNNYTNCKYYAWFEMPWWLRQQRVCLQCRRPGSIPASGVGYDHPLQYPCLENPIDRRAWKAQSMVLQRDRTEQLTLPSFCLHPLPFSTKSHVQGNLIYKEKCKLVVCTIWIQTC